MLISVQNISKAYGDNQVLENVSFQVNKGDKFAIVGRNGCGKSTLLKIIIGEETADNGEVVVASSVKVGYLSQYQSSDDDTTIKDVVLSARSDLFEMEEKLRKMEGNMSNPNVDFDALMDEYNHLSLDFEEKGGLTFRSEAVGVLKGLGFSEEEFDKKMSMLSGGEATRVSLGKLLVCDNDVLVLDEPINHLDMSSIEWLEGFLNNWNKALIIVAHDRYFLDRVVGNVVDLNTRPSRTYQGNFSSFVRQKEEMMVGINNAYEKQQKEIAHQEEVISKLQSFNREKSIKRAESRKKTLDKMETIELLDDASTDMRISLQASKRSGNDVLQIKDLACIYSDGTIFENVSFDLKRLDRVAILGDNGTGKTTILKMLTGLKEPSLGEIKLGSNVDIGYYDQAQMDLDENNTIFQEIRDVFPKLNNTKIRNTLAALAFKDDEVDKKISVLSGGERGRVALCKLMLSDANFLVLDEPTNHLDMDSKDILEKALNEYDGTVLFVSHDRYFVNKVANKVLEMNPYGVREFIGNYDYYISKKDEVINNYAALENEKTKEASEGKIDWQQQKQENALRRKKENEIAKIEDEISDLEDRIAKLDEELAKPENGFNSAKLNELSKEKEELDSLLEPLYEKWEVLSGEM